MLKVFRKNQFLRSLLIWPMAAALNVNMLFGTAEQMPPYHPVIDAWLSDTIASRPVLHWLLFSVLLFITAIFLNRMVIINRMGKEIRLYPGVFFVLIASAFPVFNGVTTITISMILWVLILSNIMYATMRNTAMDKVFNAGLYVGLMSLSFFPQVILILFVLITVSILSNLRWRNTFNLLNGVLLPVYLLGLYMIFKGSNWEAVTSVYEGQFGFVNWSLPDSIPDILTFAILILFLLFVLISHANTLAKKSNHSIRRINTLAWTIIFAVAIYLISSIESMHGLVLLTPALGFYTSEGVLRFKKESNGELIFVFLVFLSIIIPLLYL